MYLRTGSAGRTQPAGRIIGRRRLNELKQRFLAACFGHESGAQTAGADSYMRARATEGDMHTLQVRPLLALGFDIRVAHVVGHFP
jgi:hypothetical protein